MKTDPDAKLVWIDFVDPPLGPSHDPVPLGALPLETGNECPLCLVGNPPHDDGWHRWGTGPAGLGECKGSLVSCSRLLWHRHPGLSAPINFMREALLKERLGE